MEKSQLVQQPTLLIYTYDEWISNHTVYFFIGNGGNAILCCYADYGRAKQSTTRQLTIAPVTGYLEE